MKNEKQIIKKCFGGSTTVLTEITTDERKGLKLGAAITAADHIIEEATDHIEDETADTMTFDFGTVRKDRIESLIWLRDSFGIETVRYVRFAA